MKKICELCGSKKNVKHHAGGPVAFVCVSCQTVVNRYMFAKALYSLQWTAANQKDIVEMRKYAQHNHKNIKENEDDSMDVFIDEEEE